MFASTCTSTFKSSTDCKPMGDEIQQMLQSKAKCDILLSKLSHSAGRPSSGGGLSGYHQFANVPPLPILDQRRGHRLRESLCSANNSNSSRATEWIDVLQNFLSKLHTSSPREDEDSSSSSNPSHPLDEDICNVGFRIPLDLVSDPFDGNEDGDGDGDGDRDASGSKDEGSDQYYIMYVPTSDETIKRKLGERPCVINIQHQSTPSNNISATVIPSELTHDYYANVDSPICNGTMKQSEIAKMKEENPHMWEYELGAAQYNGMKQRFSQAIAATDMQLNPELVEHLASRAIAMGVTWSNLHWAREAPRRVLETLLGGKKDSLNSGLESDMGVDDTNDINDTSARVDIDIDLDKDDNWKNITLTQRYSRSPYIRCQIGTECWSEDYHGIGIIVTMESMVDVVWKKDGMNSSSSRSPRKPNRIATIHCTTSQVLPLYNFAGEQANNLDFDYDFDPADGSRYCAPSQDMFMDCSSDKDQNWMSSQIQAIPGFSYLLRKKCGEVTFQFDFKGNKKNVQRKTRTTATSSGANMGTSLSDTIKNIQRSKSANNDMTDTYMFAWGNEGNVALPGVETYEESGCKAPHNLTDIQSDFIPFEPISQREIITSIKCSSCHTLALTNIGAVYSCGNGSQGQLGHGSFYSCPKLQIISSFLDENKDRIIIQQISAGCESNNGRSLSTAVDTRGNLYTWGTYLLCGHEADAGRKLPQVQCVPKLVSALKAHKVEKVSCGGGFALALAKCNTSSQTEVFSWGTMANGRLGLGPPKVEFERAMFGQRKVKETPRFSIVPKKLSSLGKHTIIDIAAGSKHSLAVTSKGGVFAWGSNSRGECSVAEIDHEKLRNAEMERYQNICAGQIQSKLPSLWEDLYTPRRVLFRPNDGVVKISSVAAGATHSAAIDQNGLVFTWGGGGHNSCLGHGETSSYEYGRTFRKVDDTRRQVLAMSGSLDVPHWAVPRSIDSLRDVEAQYIDLGEKHGAVLTKSGNLYTWGTRKFVAMPQNASDLKYIADTVPAKPKLACLKGKQIHHVVCCADNATICLVSKDDTARTIGKRLLDQCLRFSKGECIKTLPSTLIDCILIGGDHRFYCHRVILSHRSSLLKQMILMEERQSSGNSSSAIEIILPGIGYEIAKDVLKFVYTDSYGDIDFSSFEKVMDLWRASKALQLTALEDHCWKILAKEYGCVVSGHHNISSHDCIPSFASDVSKAVNDSQFADVRILVGNVIIYAHECMLRSCGSEFFETLLDFAKLQPPNEQSRVTIELPGTPDEISRVLYFLYTGCLAKGATNDDLIKDLVNAQRYTLSDMKAQADSIIDITPKNAPDMLLLSTRISSKRLKARSMYIIANHLSRVPNVDDLLSKCTDSIKYELLRIIMTSRGISPLIPTSRKDSASAMLERSRRQNVLKEANMMKDLTSADFDGLSPKKMVIYIAVLIGYVYFQRYFVSSLGAIVPIINCLSIVITSNHLFKKIM